MAVGRPQTPQAKSSATPHGRGQLGKQDSAIVCLNTGLDSEQCRPRSWRAARGRVLVERTRWLSIATQSVLAAFHQKSAIGGWAVGIFERYFEDFFPWLYSRSAFCGTKFKTRSREAAKRLHVRTPQPNCRSSSGSKLLPVSFKRRAFEWRVQNMVDLSPMLLISL